MPMLRLAGRISEGTGGDNLDTVTKELGREGLDAGESEKNLGCKNGKEMKRREAQDSKTCGKRDRSADD
jgi:hypothetical protein